VSILLALFLATAFPSTSRTAWMRPESFHLAIGMSREETVKRLSENGWPPKKGGTADEMLVDYSDTKSMTLKFSRNRLHAIRFEFFAMPAEAHDAFDEQKSFLKTAFGAPKSVKVPSVLIYDNRLPNVMVVLNENARSTNGIDGLGMLVVSYYDPAAK